MKNNGDYVRVLGSMIQIDKGSYNSLCKEVQSVSLNGSSAMALLYSATAALTVKVFGFDCVTENTLFAVLIIIYLLGLAIYLKMFGLKTEVALMILPYLAFPQIMKSYYEEALLIPLIPWMALGLRNLFESNKGLLFTISFALFFYTKNQMIGVAPIALLALFLAQRKTKYSGKYVLMAGVIISSALLMNLSKSGFWMVNSYNRFFNGIGWSVQNVAQWPATSFLDRQLFFQKNKEDLQKMSNHLEPIADEKLMGTSVWPDGMSFFVRSGIVNKPEIFQQFGLSAFAKIMVTGPSVLLRLVTQPLKVAFFSDYNLDDISSSNSSAGFLYFLKRNLAKVYGIIFFLQLLFILCPNRKPTLQSLLVCALYLILPVAVIFGDGYVEFEKHMIPFFASGSLYYLLARTLNKPSDQWSS